MDRTGKRAGRAAVIALGALALPAAAEEGGLVSLESGWRFSAQPRAGDLAPAAEAHDDRGWATLAADDAIPGPGWLRRTVELSTAGDQAVLLPGAAADLGGYQLFADGVAIGGAGTPGDAWAPLAAPALHQLPAAATADRKVVLALHAGGPGPLGPGAVIGPTALMTARLAEAGRARAERSAPDLVGAGFFAVLLLYHLELYRRRRATPANLWFALVAAGALGVNVTGALSRFAPGWISARLLSGLNAALAACTIASLIHFTFALLERARPRWARWLAAAVLATGVLPLLAPGLAPLLMLTLLAGLAAVGTTIGVAAARGHPEARVVALGTATFVLLLGTSIVGEITGAPLPGSLPLVAFAALVLSMAFSLAGRFARSYDEVDRLNQELRRQVAERARELGNVLAELVEKQAAPVTSEAAVVDGYRLLRLLGVGGMGSVYEAVGGTPARRVALKRVRHLAGPMAHARLAREAQLAARLSHPNLVPVIDVGVTGDGIYLVMELVEGSPLDHARDRFGDAGFARPILAQVADGLAYIHASGVVHRDLKPSNVLLDRATPPRARISDFGIAGAALAELDPGADAPSETLLTLTATGAVIGTPAYMAPEQVVGARNAGPPADVFAFGVMAYELLTARAPFHPPAAQTRLAGKDPAAPPPLDPDAGGLPPATAALLDRCLHLAPEGRPTAADLTAALAAFRGG